MRPNGAHRTPSYGPVAAALHLPIARLVEGIIVRARRAAEEQTRNRVQRSVAQDGGSGGWGAAGRGGGEERPEEVREEKRVEAGGTAQVGIREARPVFRGW